MSSHPTREEIELRAYEIYIQRGCQHGRDVEDWIEAEQELEATAPPASAEAAAPQQKAVAAGRQNR